MSARFQAPRGTQDLLPAGQPSRLAVVDAIREITALFGYRRIDTPVFEYAAVFEKGSGGTTDVVEKEMYVFTDRGREVLALTPEATPAICRAYLEHGMASWPQPVRLYTVAPMFRYDRPQQGRYRQFTQFDCEVLGSSDPLVDAEQIELLWRLYERLGLTNLEVQINSIDDPAPRHAYVERLKDFYRPLLDRLSDDSRRRFDRNPLRLLDSKDERDQPFKDAAPRILDHLSAGAADHFEAVKDALTAAGIPFVLNALLVRGLDYYNRTVFEIGPKDDERAQSTIGAGGRYDGLVELLGGPATAGTGFATGIERIVLEMDRRSLLHHEPPACDVFVVHRGEGSGRHAVRLAGALRQAGVAVITGETGRSFKSQMRSADASRARIALVLGDDEIQASSAVVKDLRDGGEQTTVPQEALAAEVTRRLRA